MISYIIPGIITGVLCFFVGLLIGGRSAIPSTFLEINVFQVVSVIINLLIGVYISYFLNSKNQKLRRKYEYIIKYCNELDVTMDRSSKSIYQMLNDFSDVNKKKRILLFFKSINNKVGIIKRLSTPLINSEIESVSKLINDYYSLITGDEWGITNSFDNIQIQKFKKDMLSCKNILQNIITKCINF